MMRFIRPAVLFTLACSAAHATEQQPVGAAGNLLQVLLGLVVVLGLMAGAAWVMKRLGVAKAAGAVPVKVVGGVAISNRERILVVEVADQWIVVGVAPGRISTLSTLPRQDIAATEEASPAAKNFSAWLKHTIEKRNGSQ